MGDIKTVQGRCGTFNHEIETGGYAVGILTFASGAFGVRPPFVVIPVWESRYKSTVAYYYNG